MSDLETLDAEIRRLQQEVSAVERAPKDFHAVWSTVEAELDQAEAAFRRLGPQLSGVVSLLPEHVAERRQALVGMAIVANRKALLDSERARIKAQTEGGLSEREKTERLAQLRRQIERLCAQRELHLREREAPGEFLPRPVLHAEMAVFRKPDLERLAAG